MGGRRVLKQMFQRINFLLYKIKTTRGLLFSFFLFWDDVSSRNQHSIRILSLYNQNQVDSSIPQDTSSLGKFVNRAAKVAGELHDLNIRHGARPLLLLPNPPIVVELFQET